MQMEVHTSIPQWMSQGFQTNNLPAYGINCWKLSLCGIFQFYLISVTEANGALREGVYEEFNHEKSWSFLPVFCVLTISGILLAGCHDPSVTEIGMHQWMRQTDGVDQRFSTFYWEIWKDWRKLLSTFKERKLPDSLSRSKICSPKTKFIFYLK